VKLDRQRCDRLLYHSERGVLGTVHAERGVDAVPVCFSVDGTMLAVPVDTVKPKAPVELQRSRNLEADGRAVLLCDHWDRADWSRLWWVRASLERVVTGVEDRARLELLLAEKYPQYREHPFSDVLTFRITGLTGWSGGSGQGG
jgi:hypothetical protein